MTALDFAIRDAKAPVREIDGSNRSPRIDAINRFVGAPMGSPYCAAGVSWCFHAAGASDFPFSALAATIRDGFAQFGKRSDDPNAMLLWKGALFGWTLENGHGHIGFVRERLTDDRGHVVAIKTVEYNTDLTGSPDGDGVYERIRKCEPEFWYLNTSDFKGGDWWCSTPYG